MAAAKAAEMEVAKEGVMVVEATVEGKGARWRR